MFQIRGDVFKQVLDLPTEELVEMEKIDEAINQVSGSNALYGGQFILPYQPTRWWLWTRLSGTVLQHSLKTTLLNMFVSVLVVIYVRNKDPTWVFGLVPDSTHPVIRRMSIIRKMWGYQQPLATFILTFFVNHAFSFWNEVILLARSIQGRLNDFGLLLATNVKRNSDGTINDEAISLLEEVAQYSRLFHVLVWASFADRLKVLNTTTGLERMASRGIITAKQLDVLRSLDLPSNKRFCAPLEWMMIRANEGIETGLIKGYTATRHELLSQICQLRAKCGSIGDRLASRMPLAYTHLVQVLVDSFVLVSPFALYPDLGSFGSVVAVGITTLFYSGLLDLAKIFLDPFNNEKFCQNSIFMDIGVLIRESNSGSNRWHNASARLPF